MVIFNRLNHKFMFIIGCFVLFMLITVSATLFIVSSQTSDAAAIGIANRQQTLILRIQNQTRALIAALESESSTEEKSQALINSSRLFTESLTALMNGGTALDSGEKVVELSPPTAAIQADFMQIQTVWEPTHQALLVLTDPTLDLISDRFYDAIELIQENWANIFQYSQQAATALENESTQKVQWLKYILFTALGLTVFAAVLALWIGKRTMIRPLQIMINAMEAICYAEEVDFSRRLPHFGEDEVGDVAQLVNCICEKLQVSYDNIEASNKTMLRIKQALDNASTSVLILNAQETIIYFNLATHSILTREYTCLSQYFENENWEVEYILHQPFAQLRTALTGNFPETLAEIKQTLTVNLSLGQSLLECRITPVIQTDGSYLGWVLEWQDITLEVAIEKEINHVMRAAAQGDFSARISIKDKTNFFLTLGKSINATLSSNQEIIAQLTQVFATIAQGDLTHQLTGEYKGALANLKHDVNAMIQQLNEVMFVIQDTANEVNHASEQILAGNECLKESSHQRAASLEEVAASVEEMTSTMQYNSEHIRALRSLSQTAQQQTERGSAVIAKTITAMSGIADSSKQVGDITALIDEIAFQTNLLALNAAVEAARAGEQGRSFAVVAAEVRQLAQRSATAAKEIRQLIQHSAERITEGHQLVQQSDQTLQEIQEKFKQVTNMIQEIAVSIDEQSEGIQLINHAVSQIEQSSQQNVSVMENAAITSHTMQTQATQLHELIRFFKLRAQKH